MASGATRNIYGTVLGGPYGPGADVLKAGVYASADYTSWGFNDSTGTPQLTVTTAGVDFGSLTAASITGDSATFPIKGLDATAGNTAGGTLALTAGAGFGTGNGGATTRTGGASGAGATGNGGSSTNVGGAALSTNGTGGAVGGTGGVGSGSGPGGAVLYTSGAGGATGAAGAITLTVGAATAANGASITLNAGNGAGGTNSGGNINLVPGAAVSTGIPGKFQINSNAIITHHSAAITATDATRVIFIAPRALVLESVQLVLTTNSTSGTVTVEKLTGTTAPGSGTALLTGTIALSGQTANTVVSGTLIATQASLRFAAGDRFGIVIAGTMTSLAGCILTAGFSYL